MDRAGEEKKKPERERWLLLKLPEFVSFVLCQAFLGIGSPLQLRSHQLQQQGEVHKEESHDSQALE
jgi:hypothetical protein